MTSNDTIWIERYKDYLNVILRSQKTWKEIWPEDVGNLMLHWIGNPLFITKVIGGIHARQYIHYMHDRWRKHSADAPGFISTFITKFVTFMVDHIHIFNNAVTKRLLTKSFIQNIVRQLEYSHYRVFTYPFGKKSIILLSSCAEE
ncbi:MAG: hypothetical protein EOP45_20180 [Sphingobacteriaceae bacterium]|nr:MAG: hypothetical protein EOP45_20180 [Sphingobacteriaceae bacterium]